MTGFRKPALSGKTLSSVLYSGQTTSETYNRAISQFIEKLSGNHPVMLL